MIGRKRTYQESIAEDQKDANPPSTDNNTNSNTNAIITNTPASQPNHFSKQLLQIYYDRLFPYQEMFNWLSYYNDPSSSNQHVTKRYWCNREFSFTLKDDIYIRYKSYKNMNDWKDDIKRKCPYKIDIGALYNIEPCRRNTISSSRFTAEEKELVFDIDISDYDDVRTCCSDASICSKCWPLMACAIKCVDVSLRNDFGLKHLLWVFSGRRGIHCWCCDDITRVFDVQQRSSMINYLKLYTGNTMNNIKVDLNIDYVKYIHSSLERSYEICKKYFLNCSLKLQNVLDTEKGINYFISMIRDAYIRRDVKQKLDDIIDSDDYINKWNSIQDIFQKYIDKERKTVSNNKNNKNNNATHKRLRIRANLMEIVFSYVYPRLDVEVSRHVNHLLKSPFVVHPKTGKVCTIIDINKCDVFDPLKQPTLKTLIDELNAIGSNNNNNSKIGWKNTTLKHVVQTFRETFLNNLRMERVSMLKSKQKAAGMVGMNDY